MNYEQFRVSVPAGELDGVRVSKRGFYDGNQLEGSPLYWYTSLDADGVHWMNDSNDEMDNYLVVYEKAVELKAERILMNGLGLGCVLRALLTLDHVKTIDVVERDERIISLVSPSYPGATIHHADAFEIDLPGLWDIAWHDVWVSNDPQFFPVPEMEFLHKKYEDRVAWQGSWS